MSIKCISIEVPMTKVYDIVEKELETILEPLGDDTTEEFVFYVEEFGADSITVGCELKTSVQEIVEVMMEDSEEDDDDNA